MVNFLIFLFFDLKAFSTANAVTGYSYPFSLIFEEEQLRPYFSLNAMQFKKGILFKDGLYSFSFGYNIDSLTSLRSTLSSGFSQGRNYLNDFSLLTGKKLFSILSGYLGFYGVIENDIKLLTGLRMSFQNPYYPGFIEASFIGPGIKKADFKFITRFSLSNLNPGKNISVKELGVSFGKLDNLFAGFGVEFNIFRNFYPGLGISWVEGKPIYPSIFVTLGTNFVERTDYLFSFALNFLPDDDLRFSFSFNILTGDEKWKEKERERKRKEKERIEKLVAEAKRKFSESERMLEEVKRLNQEIERKKRQIDSLKQIIEKEKQEVEKMREEALEALRKIEGIKIQEEKEYIKITASEKAVHFEIGGTGLTVESILTLKKIAKFLKTYPGYKVKVYGHTDNIPIGPLLKKKYKDNFELSEARAKAVVDYFVKVENLKDLEFEYKGFGDTKPIASNDTEEGRAKNRRVEIIIEKKK